MNNEGEDKILECRGDLEVGYLDRGMLHDLPVRLLIAVSEVQSARRRLRADPGTMSASLSPSLHPQVD